MKTNITEPHKLQRKLPSKATKADDARSAEYLTTSRRMAFMAAKKLVQLTALRLQIEKEEAEAKEDVVSYMKEFNLEHVNESVTLDGRPVTIEVKRGETAVTSLDTAKLRSLLTDEQFMQCASVTATDAAKVLPQAMIDTCKIVGTPRVSFKVTATKGFPVPTVKLFR